MKFLLEFVTCCTSGAQEPHRSSVESKLLVVQEPRRRIVRKHGRLRHGGGREWRPSLSSISEDELTVEKVKSVDRPAPRWRRSLQRKFASISRRDRRRSLDHEDTRRSTPLSELMTGFSPTAAFVF